MQQKSSTYVVVASQQVNSVSRQQGCIFCRCGRLLTFSGQMRIRFWALGFLFEVVSVLTNVKWIHRDGLTFAASCPLSLAFSILFTLLSYLPYSPNESSVSAICFSITVVALYLWPSHLQQSPGYQCTGFPPFVFSLLSCFPSGNLIHCSLMASSRHLCTHCLCT